MSAPRVGQTVRYPADRGDLPGYARIAHVGTTVETNIHGVRFVWVTLKSQGQSRGVWPSHRLGFKLEV